MFVKGAEVTELIFVVEEAPEGGYTARSLGPSIYSEADSLEDLKREIVDAVHCHFEPEQVPKLVRLHVVREEILPV